MKKNILLVLLAGLVMSVTADVVVTVKGGSRQFTMSSTDLHNLHMCLCEDANDNCQYHPLNSNRVTPRLRDPSEFNSSTQYSNVYLCHLFGSLINCTRNRHKPHSRIPIQLKGESFSLRNETCDMKCVDFMWDTTVSNITIHTDTINGELCPATPFSSSQETIITTTVIVIAVVSVVVAIIIFSIIVKCVCDKRKKHLKTTNTTSCIYTDTEKISGLYAVSSAASPYPDLDRAQEPLYYDLENDKKDSRETTEAIELQSNNVYTKLHEKCDHMVNTYDVLPQI